MSTASQMISATRSTGSLFTSFRNSRQAKSVWRPSSRLMSSFEKHRPGMSPRFLSQKTAQKEPEKKIPSTAANATRRSAYEASSGLHHRSAHLAFRRTQGTVSMALKRCAFSAASFTYVSISRL